MMEVTAENSILRSVPAQCTFSALTKIVSGSFIQENVEDQVNQIVGRSRVHAGGPSVVVARELHRVGHLKEVPNVVPKVAIMATREGVDSRVALMGARGDRGGRTSFFSY